MAYKFKTIALGLATISALLMSCNKSDEPIESEKLVFTESEMAVLGQSLALPEDLYNYANIHVPDYFSESYGSLPDQDNTPLNNPITDIGATLGRVLFYDKNLSLNNTISCASCHQQANGFSDTARFSTGYNGELTLRNSMSLINSRWYLKKRFFWDERANTLEEQVLMPIQDHIEMGLDLDQLVIKLGQLDYYNVLFNKAFGSPEITTERISKSLSQFTRSIVSFNSKFNRAVQADGLDEVPETDMIPLSNLSRQENIGLDIFYNLGTCGYCHIGPAHVADSTKNNGLDLIYTDEGRATWSGNPTDVALFKPPSLANIELTAPYMHDGRFATLMDVVNHYSDNVQGHPHINFRLTTEDIDGTVGGTPLRLQLNQEQKEALVAFLKTFTDETLTDDKKYSDPFK